MLITTLKILTTHQFYNYGITIFFLNYILEVSNLFSLYGTVMQK